MVVVNGLEVTTHKEITAPLIAEIVKLFWQCKKALAPTFVQLSLENMAEEVYTVHSDGVMVAFASVYFTADYETPYVVVDAICSHKDGAGGTLLKYLMETTHERKFTGLKVHAIISAVPWYLSAGFRFVTECYESFPEIEKMQREAEEFLQKYPSKKIYKHLYQRQAKTFVKLLEEARKTQEINRYYLHDTWEMTKCFAQ